LVDFTFLLRSAKVTVIVLLRKESDQGKRCKEVETKCEKRINKRGETHTKKKIKREDAVYKINNDLSSDFLP